MSVFAVFMAVAVAVAVVQSVHGWHSAAPAVA